MRKVRWSKCGCPGAVAIAALVLAVLSAPGRAGGATIPVPVERATIQEAINAAAPGDTVLVAAGTYMERLDFLGKAITVRSESGPSSTIIDGGGGGQVVRFASGEGVGALLEGFTIQHGSGSGAGVVIGGASARLFGNVIRDNRGSIGAGILVSSGSPLIRGNTVEQNVAADWGGGIALAGTNSARVEGNTIRGNEATEVGGGIGVGWCGTPTVLSNRIVENRAGSGGGVGSYSSSSANIYENLIAHNSAVRGGGIYWSTALGSPRTYLSSNTIADNTAEFGSGIYTIGYSTGVSIENNIVWGVGPGGGIYCGDFGDVGLPAIRYNDVVGWGGPGYAGLCGDRTGRDGNIADDPLFADRVAGDFRLQSASHCIDAGDNTAFMSGDSDIDGGLRLVDGNGDEVAVVDLGAYERAVPPGGPTFPARAFAIGHDGQVPRAFSAPFLCLGLEPAGSSFRSADVDLSTVRLAIEGASPPAPITPAPQEPTARVDSDGNGLVEVPISFAREDLVSLFSGVERGTVVPVVVTGELLAGGSFRAPLEVCVGLEANGFVSRVGPNPTRGTVTFRIEAASQAEIRVRVYDVNGRCVRVLRNDPSSCPACREISLDGRDSGGRPLASGLYFYRIETADGIRTGRLTILR